MVRPPLLPSWIPAALWSSDSFSLPSAFVAFLIGREKGRGFSDAFQRSPVYGRSSLPWVFPVKDSNGSGLRIFCRVPGLDPVRVLVRPLWFLVWMPRPLPLRLSDRAGEGHRLPAVRLSDFQRSPVLCPVPFTVFSSAKELSAIEVYGFS